MVEGRILLLWTCSILLALTTAGPLHRYPRETEDYQNMDLSAYANYTANEVCFSDNEVFQRGALMPNPGPCEECRCEPPSIVCHMLKCPVNNNGCRTLQRPNHCCPDYNCECDYNGQLYNDGERIDLPEEPCQVCYCKGGDVMCTSITCYHRDDCEPIHVPGQCCPKYENCPLRDQPASSGDDKNVRTRSPNHSPKREMQPWLLTKSVLHTSSSPLAKPVEDMTTEDSVIIVSDWLSERRSTTEDGVRHEGTMGPAGATGPYSNRHSASTVNPDGSIVRSDTITPVDEVIFTRVDMLRQKPAPQSESTTFAPGSTLKEETSTSSESIQHDQTSQNIAISNSESSTELTITPKISDSDTHLSNILNVNSLVNDVGYKENSTGTVEITLNEKDSTMVELKGQSQARIEGSKTGETEESDNPFTTGDYYTTEMSEHKIDSLPKMEMQNHDVLLDVTPTLVSNNKPFNKELDHVSPENNKHKLNVSAENVSLDGLFVLDEINEGNNNFDNEAINKSAVRNINTSATFSNYGDEKNIEPDDQETAKHFESSTSDGINVYYANDALNYKSENIKFDGGFGETLRPSESDQSTLGDSTTEKYSELQSTTPYVTEDHMSELNLKSDEIVPGDDLTEDTSQFYEATTYFDFTTPQTAAIPNDESQQKIDQMNGTYRLSKGEIKNITLSFFEKGLSGSDAKLIISNDQDVVSKPNENTLESGKSSHTKDYVDVKIFSNSNTSVEESVVHVENVVSLSDKTSKESVEESFDENASLEHDSVDESHDSSEELTGNAPDDVIITESKEFTSNPPILDLNSHVPYLQIGGHYNSDVFSGLNDQKPKLNTTAKSIDLQNEEMHVSYERTEEHNPEITSKPLLETTTSVVTTTQSNQGNDMNTGEFYTTSHIPLTPGDLKVIAEYMINTKITPVTQNNDSSYSENQWLKGNLTSEEKMASILSAANITIGIINQTYTETKSLSPETSTKTNEIIKVEKLEKDLLFKGNSIFDDKSATSKNSKALDTSKSYLKVEKLITTTGLPQDLTSNGLQDKFNTQSFSSMARNDEVDSTNNDSGERTEMPRKTLTETTFLISDPHGPAEGFNNTNDGDVSTVRKGLSRTQDKLDSGEETVMDQYSSVPLRSQDTTNFHKKAP